MQKILPKKHYALIGIIAAIIFVVAWSLKVHSANKQTSPTIPVVKATIAEQADKNMPLEISGFAKGADRADISPMASGTILRIFKHEGQSVQKGDVLATIKADQSDAQVSAANASVDALEKTLSDSKKYYNQLVDQAKSAPNSDQTDEAVKSAKRALDLQDQAVQDQIVAAQGSAQIAQAGKNNFILTAPFSGTIVAVYGREGGFANFSMPIMNIATPSSLEIETYVTAADARNISVGSVATLQSPNGAPISGTVTTVSPGSDPLSLKTLVRIRINDSSNFIALGDFMHGEIMIPRQQNAISIPRNAIVSRGGDPVVFVLDKNNIAKEQPITIGDEYGGFVDITNGIEANQKIVTEGQQYLINGSATTLYATN